MNKKTLKQSKVQEKLNILACELYYACYDPDISKNKGLLSVLRQALSILEKQIENTSPHIILTA